MSPQENSTSNTPVRLAVVEQRLKQHDIIHDEIRHTLCSISKSLTDIIRIEERQMGARADLDACFTEIRELEKRVEKIESSIPDLKTLKTIVFSSVSALLVSAGQLVYYIITHNH